MRLFRGFVVMGSLFVSSIVSADGGVCGNGHVVVKALVGQAVEIVLENGVGDLVRSGDPSTLKVEHTSGHLFLTPLSPLPAQVTIIDMQGQSHLVQWVFDQPADRKIVIGDCAPDDRGDKGQDAAMAFMRDLLRGRMPTGAVKKDTDEVMFDDARVRMRAVVVYQAQKFWGYVMTVENLTAAPVPIPLQQMSFPGLLAVSSSMKILAQGEKGNIYMVVAR